MRYLWIIETKDRQTGEWVATSRAYISRDKARAARKTLSEKSPNRHYTVRKYVCDLTTRA